MSIHTTEIDDSNQVITLGTGTSVAAFRNEINTAMTSLGGGYTLTDADLSAFTSY